jgi:hypothetical protein
MRRKEAERYLQVSPPKALFEDMADKMAATFRRISVSNSRK